MKLGIISLGSESSNMIAKASKKYFSEVDTIDLREVEVDAGTSEVEVLYKGEKLKKYDCLYCRGSSKYAVLLRAITSALEKETYMPLSPFSFLIGHDKYLTLIELQKKGIRIPKTYLAANTESAKKIIKQIHYPAIIKIPAGTHGKGVLFADSVESANTILDALEVFNQSYIIQEYVETGATDLRAIVINNKVVACMKRIAAKGDLRANVHSGGSGESYKLDEISKEMCIKCSKAIRADICAIDILKGIKPHVIEVNLSPGIQGISKFTKKDIADEIAKGLYEKTKEFKTKAHTEKYNGVLKEFNINKDHDKIQQIVTNATVKLGKIRLPEIATKISGFEDEEEILIKVKKDKIIIKKPGD